MKRKTILFVFLLMASVMMLLSSCITPEIIGQLETEDVVELVEASLQEQTGGLEAYIEQLLEKIDELDVDPTCDSLYAEELAYSYQGARFQGSYEADWTFLLSCNDNNKVEAADFTSASNADYTTARISAADSVSFNGSVSGLRLISPDVILDGTYIRSGAQTIDGRNDQLNINSLLDIQLATLTVSKLGTEIEFGLATFSLTGDAGGNSFSYSGTLEFLGNKTATLTLDGTVYNLDWN